MIYYTHRDRTIYVCEQHYENTDFKSKPEEWHAIQIDDDLVQSGAILCFVCEAYRFKAKYPDGVDGLIAASAVFL